MATILAVPNVRERFRRMLDRLPEVLSLEPARAREALREVLPPEITLRPAPAGGYLLPAFGVEMMPLAACAGGRRKNSSGGRMAFATSWLS